jgi:hypothetical protein
MHKMFIHPYCEDTGKPVSATAKVKIVTRYSIVRRELPRLDD